MGGAVGEATLGRRVGNKAVLWGAVGGTIPDLDTIAGHFMGTVERLVIHRGPTHSLLFALAVAPVVGLLLIRLHKREEASWRDWSLLMFLALFTHALLDCFTTWGTQLFWPLDYRIAWKSIFVIDPLYTVPFLICLVWLTFHRRESRFRRSLNLIGLTLSTLYLIITLVNKQVMNGRFENILKSQNINYLDYDTKPTPLNNILWSVTAETEDGFYIGYHSFFDSGQSVPLFFFAKNHNLLNEYENEQQVQQLLSVTKGYYTVESEAEALIVNDLRFGQTDGWSTGTGDFVFAYEIRKSTRAMNSYDKVEIAQRPNSLKVGARMLRQFWTRIRGV